MRDCPFCDEPILDGTGVLFGGEVLHKACHMSLNEELDGLWSQSEDETIEQTMEQEVAA